MADDEPALLHEPDLMLAVLRAARQGPAGLDDAMARLQANLAAAHEPPPGPGGDLRRRLERAALLLRGADAIAPAGDDRFRLTARGARLLADHPDGVDETVLLALPGFRAFRAALSPRRSEDDPHPLAFQAGLQAFAEGRSLADNPHAFASVDHLAWECGWSEARAREAREGEGGRSGGRARATRAPPVPLPADQAARGTTGEMWAAAGIQD